MLGTPCSRFLACTVHMCRGFGVCYSGLVKMRISCAVSRIEVFEFHEPCHVWQIGGAANMLVAGHRSRDMQVTGQD